MIHKLPPIPPAPYPFHASTLLNRVLVQTSITLHGYYKGRGRLEGCCWLQGLLRTLRIIRLPLERGYRGTGLEGQYLFVFLIYSLHNYTWGIVTNWKTHFSHSPYLSQYRSDIDETQTDSKRAFRFYSHLFCRLDHIYKITQFRRIIHSAPKQYLWI